MSNKSNGRGYLRRTFLFGLLPLLSLLTLRSQHLEAYASSRAYRPIEFTRPQPGRNSSWGTPTSHGNSTEQWSVGGPRAVQNRLTGREGKKYLFFKHIREPGGGTSTRNYLQAVHAYHAAQFNWTYYEQELTAMHWDCPRLDDSRWNNSVRVIILHHPIERHLSEYFHAGLPRDRNATDRDRLLRMHNSNNYGRTFFELLEQRMVPWILEGAAGVQGKTTSFHDHFSDESQVRALSGETEELPYTEKPSICRKSPRSSGCEYWDNPCSYGGGWVHGGAFANHEVNQLALERAQTNLALFDLVLLSETMGDPYQVEYAAAVLDVPTTHASLSQKKKKRLVDWNGKSVMLAGLKEHAPTLLSLLEERSKWELQLYEYAQQLNRERLHRWVENKINHLIAD